jgi:hypothetical protein
VPEAHQSDYRVPQRYSNLEIRDLDSAYRQSRTLLIRYNQERVKILPSEVAQQLRKGTPSIELNPATGSREGSAGIPRDPDKIVVGVWMLEPDEDLIVGRRLREVLAKAAKS